MVLIKKNNELRRFEQKFKTLDISIFLRLDIDLRVYAIDDLH